MTRPLHALVVGATASLAKPMCILLARRGYRLTLAGRDMPELEKMAADLTLRENAQCNVVAADFMDSGFSPRALVEGGDFTHIIIAAGDLGRNDITDIRDIAYVAHVNYTVPAQIAAAAAARLANHGGGTIVVISSISGDRGRARMAAYSSAKAALTAFASALRQAYARRGVHVLTAKPGFTDTSMTWGMKSRLMASRDSVAKKIIRAMEKKKNVVYAPCFWRFIMLTIQHIPEWLFKRLSF